MKNLPSIEKVLLVDGIYHILLSISQLWDGGCDVVFNKDQCITNNNGGIKLFIANRQ